MLHGEAGRPTVFSYPGSAHGCFCAVISICVVCEVEATPSCPSVTVFIQCLHRMHFCFHVAYWPFNNRDFHFHLWSGVADELFSSWKLLKLFCCWEWTVGSLCTWIPWWEDISTFRVNHDFGLPAGASREQKGTGRASERMVGDFNIFDFSDFSPLERKHKRERWTGCAMEMWPGQRCPSVMVILFP